MSIITEGMKQQKTSGSVFLGIEIESTIRKAVVIEIPTFLTILKRACKLL